MVAEYESDRNFSQNHAKTFIPHNRTKMFVYRNKIHPVYTTLQCLQDFDTNKIAGYCVGMGCI